MSWKIIIDMENCPHRGIELCSHVDGLQYCNESTCPLKDLRETNKVHISRELLDILIDMLYFSDREEMEKERPDLYKELKEVEQL